MTVTLSTDQTKWILGVMKKHRLNPKNYRHENPFNFDTPVAQNLQLMLQEDDPIQAAELKAASSGGYMPSFAAAAYEQGLTPLTQDIHQEKVENDPIYVRQQRAAAEQWEKDQLAAMEKAVADIQTAKYGKPLDLNEPNFGSGWQGDAMRRQYELDKAMGGSWN